MKREIAEGNIWFGKDGSNTPRIKKFLRDAKIGHRAGRGLKLGKIAATGLAVEDGNDLHGRFLCP